MIIKYDIGIVAACRGSIEQQKKMNELKAMYLLMQADPNNSDRFQIQTLSTITLCRTGQDLIIDFSSSAHCKHMQMNVNLKPNTC